MASNFQHDVNPTAPVGFVHHNHQRCVATAVSAAEAYCTAKNLRFTPVRRAVLEILLQEHRALGAYAIMDRMREAGFSAQPPVAYRALDFLVTQGFVHKIERLSAFIACSHPGEHHSPTFMICRICSTVAEAPATPVSNTLGAAAQAAGFQIERTVIEAEGVCPRCCEKNDP